MLKKLRLFWRQRTTYYQQRFNRSLPFGDCVVDRWDKANILGFGKGSSIYDSSLVLGDVKVGLHSWIGPNTILDGSGGGLVIGDYSTISAGVQIYTHDTVARTLSGGRQPISHEPTRIGSNCYIGPNVIVVKGVTIGNNVIIGANSLVLSSIPSFSKAYGTPARVVAILEEMIDVE